MKLRSTIFWVLLLQCALFAEFSSECPQFSDPNDYIDDPNTLDNGLFECGDSNLTQYGFTPPIYWERLPIPGILPDCYSSLIFRSPDPNIPSFVPQPEHADNIGKVNWSISAPYEGDSFVLLSTGDLGSGYSDSDVQGSLLSHEVYLFEGDTILGAYFFGTCDYPNYDDHGEIYLESIDPPHTIYSIIDPNDPNDMCATGWVKKYGSTENWKTFEYAIETGMAGNYKIYCKVEDGGNDKIFKSYFAVDNLRICHGEKTVSDINFDCDVNLIDYSILSEAWLSFCPGPSFNDPNSSFDPNNFPPVADPNVINYEADLNDDWYVDANDLVIMSDQWLFGFPTE